MARRLTTEEFIAKAEQVHNGKYDYSDTVYVTSRELVTVICPKHGPFRQRASMHLMGCGCPRCQYEWTDEHRANLVASVRRSRGLTQAVWPERAR